MPWHTQPHQFEPGDRVTGTFSGKVRTGTVLERRGRVVWLTWDDQPQYRRWVHDISISKLEAGNAEPK